MEWTRKVWKPVEENRVAKISSDALREEYAIQLMQQSDKESIAKLTACIKETCIYARIQGALNFLKGWTQGWLLRRHPGGTLNCRDRIMAYGIVTQICLRAMTFHATHALDLLPLGP